MSSFVSSDPDGTSLMSNNFSMISQEKLQEINTTLVASAEIQQNLEEQCFHKVLENCIERKWTVILKIHNHVMGLTDLLGRSIYQILIEKGEENCISDLANQSELAHLVESLSNGKYRFGIHFAVEKNRANLFQFLTMRGSSIEEVDLDGKKPIHKAIEYGYIESLKGLHAFGAFLSAQFIDRNTRLIFSPIAYAVFKEQIDCFDYLIETGVHIQLSLHEKIQDVGSLLHLAIRFSRNGMLEHLLTKYFNVTKGLLDEREPKTGQTPLILAASLDNLEAINLLVKKGAKIEACDYNRKTALHHSVISKKEAATHLLVSLGADTNAKDLTYKTPVRYAEDKGFINESIRNFLELKNIQNVFDSHSLPNFYRFSPAFLVFQGGGPKGIAYIGVLKELERLEILKKIERVCGTSAGALTALAVSLDINSQKLEEILTSQPLSEFRDFPSTKGGLCKGEVMRKFIAKIICMKTGDENFTFGELRQKIEQGASYKHLHVIATKFGQHSDIIEFSTVDRRWQDLIIADAVCASMRLPIFFEPHILHFKDLNSGRSPRPELGSYVDGGILKNLGIEIFDKKRYVEKGNIPFEEIDCEAFNKRTLGFSLYSPEKIEKEKIVTSIVNASKKLGQTLYEAEEIIRRTVAYNKHRVVKINNKNVGTFEFDLNRTKMDELIESGIETTRCFFENEERRFLEIFGLNSQIKEPPNKTPNQTPVLKVQQLTVQTNNTHQTIYVSGNNDVAYWEKRRKNQHIFFKGPLSKEELEVFTLGPKGSLRQKAAYIGIRASVVMSGIFTLGIGGAFVPYWVKWKADQSLKTRKFELLALDDSRFTLFVHLSNHEEAKAEEELVKNYIFYKSITKTRVFLKYLSYSKQEYVDFGRREES